MRRWLSLFFAIFVIGCSSASAVDISSLSFDQLVSLREQVILEMMRRDDWQYVQVPAGTYQIGKHIPAGHWLITCAPRSYCYVNIGGAVESNGKDMVYGSESYYHIAMAGIESGISDRGYPSSVDLVLKDGMYISIEHAYVTFSPYTGDLGFTFK